MDKSYIYLIFAIAAAAAFFIIVPKAQYKRHLLYGLIFGGIADVISLVTLAPLQQIRFSNMGHFGLFGMFPVWVPVTWMFAFGVFFYLMPRRLPFLIPYLCAFTALSYVVGLVMESYGLFEYIGAQRYWAVPIFFVWYSVAAWVYHREIPAGIIQPAALKPRQDEEE